MESIDWKRKLTSRKFWAAVAEFVTMLVIAFGGSQEQAVQISALIMAGAAVIAYIIGEGLADAAGAAGANSVKVIQLDSGLPDPQEPPDEQEEPAEEQ